MSTVRNARAYFRRRKPIHRLPRDLVTPFDHSRLDENETLLLKAGAAKDRHGVRRLLQQYGTQRAIDILPHLPVRQVTALRTRIMNWLRRLEGSSEHDPLVAEIRRMNRSERYTIRHGYLETPLDE